MMGDAEWRDGDDPNVRRMFGHQLRAHVAYQDGRDSEAPTLVFADYDYEVGDGTCGLHADGKQANEPAIVYVRADALVDALARTKAAEARADELEAEIQRCHERLEIDHYYEMGEGDDLVHVEITDMEERKSFPDAVTTREASLALHEEYTDELAGQVMALRDVIQAAIDCGMVPKSSAKEGGAMRHSEMVRVADRLRDTLSDTASAANRERARVRAEALDEAVSAVLNTPMRFAGQREYTVRSQLATAIRVLAAAEWRGEGDG